MPESEEGNQDKHTRKRGIFRNKWIWLGIGLIVVFVVLYLVMYEDFGSTSHEGVESYSWKEALIFIAIIIVIGIIDVIEKIASYFKNLLHQLKRIADALESRDKPESRFSYAKRDDKKR